MSRPTTFWSKLAKYSKWKAVETRAACQDSSCSHLLSASLTFPPPVLWPLHTRLDMAVRFILILLFVYTFVHYCHYTPFKTLVPARHAHALPSNRAACLHTATFLCTFTHYFPARAFTRCRQNTNWFAPYASFQAVQQHWRASTPHAFPAAPVRAFMYIFSLSFSVQPFP